MSKQGEGSPLREAGRIIIGILLGLLVAPVIVILVYRIVPPQLTPLMLIRGVEGYALVREWKPLSAISRNLQRAVIASEDTKFCTHHGFDWDAVDTAIERYQVQHGRMLGASTISMQTSKNLFLWPGRTLLRKGLEAYLTVALEALLPKSRILELYLNIVEWGRGLYGAEAAARANFGVSAAQLTPYQAALLAAVLPDPRVWRAGHPGPGMRARADMIMGRMNQIVLGKNTLCP